MEQKRRRGKIWSLDRTILAEIVSKSPSLASVLHHFNLSIGSGNYSTLKAKLVFEKIDFSHIKLGRGANGGRNFSRPKLSLSVILVQYSTYSTNDLKKRLVKELQWEYKCKMCELPGIWNNSPLSLHLDHINGTHTDHRLENLRLLCPNCHSQTPTFGGRKNSTTHVCQNCGVKVTRTSRLCRPCLLVQPRVHRRKVQVRPSKETLLEQVDQLGYAGTGRLYGIIGGTVKLWLKAYGVLLSPKRSPNGQAVWNKRVT